MPETPARPPSPATRERCWLPRSRRAPATARVLLRSFLSRQQDGEHFIDKAELLVSELVTNALVHGTRADQLIRLTLEVEDRLLRISVEDASADPPCLGSGIEAETEAVSGRGLLLVDRLAEKWGWGPRDGIGKLVWCTCTPASDVG
ncbi:ATP-binding protein [Kitasatospora sp. LaBMicrA B282]|uniref:ATP-binding protein n=1 Tax=Kitasatospora sp. LaBMicrA B282 TaxID=3420949 RepID=UPI003D0EDE29